MTFTGFWSWHGFQTSVIPYEECLLRLIRCAGGNGNLLANVGPLPTGQIDPREVDRMTRMGAWLSKNGESVYGTKGGPFSPGQYGVSTRKGNVVYVHVLKWHGEELQLPSLADRVKCASVLGGAPVEFKQDESGLRLTVHARDRVAVDTIVVLNVQPIKK